MCKLNVILACFIPAAVVSAGEWHFMGFKNEAIHAVAVHPENPNIIFVSGDNLYKTIEGGWMWDTVAWFPANSMLFHPLNPDTMYATLGAGSYSDGVYKSTDGGNTWNVIHNMMYATSLVIPSFPEGILVAGCKGGGVERSDDGGVTWYSMNDSLDNLNILSLATVSPFDSAPVFLAGTEAGIYCFFTEYWVKTNAAGLTVPSIAVYREYIPVLWAALDGGSWSDGMYKSIDYGLSWEVSEWWVYITDILVNSLDSQTVYAADSGWGVMITRNGGTDWNLMNENLGDSVVFCLSQTPADTVHLYAGTSHGLYVYDFCTGIQEVPPHPDRRDVKLKISPNIAYLGSPLGITYWIPPELYERMVSIRLYDISGRLAQVLFEGRTETGWNSLIWDGGSVSGAFLLHLKIGGFNTTKKVILMR
ncbi:MAG: hypothetical protein U9R01_02400 [candidate division WOR-3 bacterium]|nr:hypothetical protein [candidate division WOR-3 bacterium]